MIFENKIRPLYKAVGTRLLVPLIMAAGPAFAQSSAVGASSPSGNAGTNVVVNISNSSTGLQPAADQWTITYVPGDLTFVNIAAGAAATAAGKSPTCSNNATAGLLTCVIYGINDNAMANGVVATITWAISSSTSHTSTLLALSNGGSVSAYNSACHDCTIPTTTMSGTVTIQHPVSGPGAPSGLSAPGVAMLHGLKITLPPGAIVQDQAGKEIIALVIPLRRDPQPKAISLPANQR